LRCAGGCHVFVRTGDGHRLTPRVLIPLRGGHGVSEHGVTGGRRGLGRGRLLRGYGGVGPLTAAGLFAQLSEVLYGTPVVSVYGKGSSFVRVHVLSPGGDMSEGPATDLASIGPFTCVDSKVLL